MGLFWWLVFFVSLFHLHSVSSLNSDGVTLLSLLSHWTSVSPSIKSSWVASHSTPCSWVGVQCDPAHHVVSLNLTSYGITGQLGLEIGNLTHLQHLELIDNYLSGQIPHTLKNLNHLNFISLSTNLLTGEIPDFLTQIHGLEFIELSYNNLSGPIPPDIGNLTQLQFLYLQDNQLSRTIPPSIGNCTKLQELYLDRNKLEGTLPQSLNNLKELTYFDVARNNLTGTIPLGSGNCKNLLFLDLSFNVFSGGLPSALGNCTSLTELVAVGCNLDGTIPSSFGLLTKLSKLTLPENYLSGKIPPEIGNCRSLMGLHLYSNRLEGNIPSELGKLSKMEDLELFSNQLTGEIPLSVWKIQRLQYLLVYNNSLSGELPLEMTELKQLKNISLFNNQFSGIIPQSLGINSSLVALDFTNNKFTGNLPPNLCFGKKLSLLLMGINQLQGSIPPNVGSCTTLTRVILKQNNFTGPLPDFDSNPNLYFMDISNNKINGAIPSGLGSCTNLTNLNLSMNKFTGLIPSELGNLMNLQILSLAHNNLKGPLPFQLSNCAKLEEFDAGFNFLNGSLPSSLQRWMRLSTLILSENHFSGGIPSFLSGFKLLSELQLGGNMFGGRISGSIGALQSLRYGLNLSSNGLIGDLPAEIGNLNTLQTLDLSQNNLTGSIEVIGELSSLLQINVSYNSFHGRVPKMLMKRLNSSLSSFVGNPGLCISCSPSDGSICNESSFLKPCDSKSANQKGLSKVEIVLIALGSSIFVVLLVLGLLCIFVFGRKSKQDTDIAANEGLSSLLNKVMEATENLNDRYIIGRGAHGVVYKALVGPDKAFAVKKLEFSASKGKNLSMVREIQTLGKIKHRNLVKLVDFWLKKDYGLILYSYMPNGSLHDVLHEKNPPASLEWNIRYKIAVGIAHGLTYLHYDCDPPIVHRDIKPKNILLDSDMEPHIGDFGIAKLLDQASTSNPSICVPGTIGYIAPENAYTAANSRESDVYSYGVVLLALITRKKAVDPSFVEGTDIVSWVRSVWNETGEINQVVDSSLSEEFLDTHKMENATKVLVVALRCTEQDPRRRPTMTDVTKQLSDADLRQRTRRFVASW
ncbi:receptor-like protein kinase isoform X2 [Lotus japonicus]|uniref:receptor-like protein kinase isoform X2 n=1 Tax=Lotus japonicus TaxID=34305 RepID=UPI0025858A70|nr:receptor-like protein kinase isoform X2 [Lotus japonicus]